MPTDKKIMESNKDSERILTPLFTIHYKLFLIHVLKRKILSGKNVILQTTAY